MDSFNLPVMAAVEGKDNLDTQKKRKAGPSLVKPSIWLPFKEKSKIETNFVTSSIRDKLKACEGSVASISIKVHSVICYKSGEIFNSNAIGTIKMSLLPLPAKVTQFKSVSVTSTASPNEDGLTNTIYNFDLKTAKLSMGVGDVRSSIFKEGISPILFIEFSVSGFVATSSIYLPSLVSEHAGEVLQMNLCCKATKEKMFDHATAILEVNIPSALKQTAKISRPLRIKLSIVGLIGPDLKNVKSLVADLELSCSLASTGKSQVVDMTPGVAYTDSLLNLFTEINIESLSPSMDMIELKLRGKLANDFKIMEDFGSAFIPCNALQESAQREEGAADFIAFNSIRWEEKTVVQKWQVVCKIIAKESSVDDDVGIAAASESKLEDEAATAAAEEEEAVTATNEKGEEVAVALPKKQIPAMVKSKSGQLQFCVQGFLCRRTEKGAAIIAPQSKLVVEITTLPDGIKEKTAPSAPFPLACADFECSVEWNKTVAVSTVWSLQQVCSVRFTFIAQRRSSYHIFSFAPEESIDDSVGAAELFRQRQRQRQPPLQQQSPRRRFLRPNSFSQQLPRAALQDPVVGGLAAAGASVRGQGEQPQAASCEDGAAVEDDVVQAGVLGDESVQAAFSRVHCDERDAWTALSWLPALSSPSRGQCDGLDRS